MRPKLLGIVNITEDSFSDGGRFFEPRAAIEHGLRLLEEGADILDLGAAASNPSARPVPPDEEIARLTPVCEGLLSRGAALSIDSFATETQRFAVSLGVNYLNDIQGFADPSFYAELARAECFLIAMHSSQRIGKATRAASDDPRPVTERVIGFFEERIAALEQAGVARERLILDPGMGFFLSPDALDSVRILREIPQLRERFGLPVLVSTSRKSFLREIAGVPLEEAGTASLASEIFAAAQGVQYIRTHQPKPLRESLRVWEHFR